MKKPKRKMRKRDKYLILFIVAFGVAGAGFEIWLNTKVDEWDLDKRPADTQQEQPQQQSGYQEQPVNEHTDTFAKVDVAESM